MKRPIRILVLSLAASSCIALPGLVQAQNFPGGFVEKSYAAAGRKTVTSTSFLPAGRGPFTFPAPYNTQGVRITVPADCGGTDCVQIGGYSYWALMNNHVGSNTMYIVLNLRGNGGPTLFSYDKATDAVTKTGALFASGPHASSSTEAWYFSATQPSKLYTMLTMDSKLQRYDVATRTFQTVFDVASNTALFGANRYIWQAHSSADDSVHSFTVKSLSNYSDLGCGVYKESTGQFLFYPATGNFDECQVDQSGRWLQIKGQVDGLDGDDNRIIDLQSGAEKQLLDRAGAPGHSDMGHGYMVGADNWAPNNYSTKLWSLGQSPMRGIEVYRASDWNAGGPQHISHLNAKPGVAPAQQYVCGSGSNATSDARGNELMCFRLDGSYDTLIVAPIMTQVPASVTDLYYYHPKANVDVTGQYAIWTSNLGTNRMDAIIAKIPSQKLVGTVAPPPPDPTPADTLPPAVSLTAPAAGATLSGTAAVLSAQASDEIGVAGVQFKVDGSDIGPEDTVAPYTISWNTLPASNGSHVLTAVARDAAGNTATSSPVSVTVDNAAGPTSPSTVESVVWGQRVNVRVVGDVLQKSAGCDGCADAGAVSKQRIADGDGYVEFEASEVGTSRALGLSHRNTDTSVGDIDFALSLTKSYAEVRENGVYKADIPYAAGDKLRVAVVNGKVRYSKNGVVFHTSAKAPAYPLLADASLGTPNATIKKAMIKYPAEVAAP
jgi:hypothetical protein